MVTMLVMSNTCGDITPAVVIAGAGPTGMMLAAELTIAGVDIAVIERRSSVGVESSRSGGLQSRTIEVLDQRGVVDRFLAEGEAMQVQSFAGIPLDISDFPTRHNYGLALWQSHFERILAGWVEELGVHVVRERDVTGFTQDDSGITVDLSDDTSIRAEYLVGCDGGRSAVRKAAGIAFAGWDATTTWLVAEAEMTEQPEMGLRHERGGVQAIGRAGDDKLFRVVLTEPDIGNHEEPTLEDLSKALVTIYGTDFGVHSPAWISCFTDLTRQAVSYRSRRVLLAGDAAHVHPPQGGQGLNTSVQDAVNLGWKLAQVVEGTSPEGLLDTYHAERHPVGARVLRNTMTQVKISATDDRTEAVRETMEELLAMDEPRKRIAGMLSGLDIRYELGGDHPLVGRRMPDLDLLTSSGPTRMFSLLNDARGVLLNLGRSVAFDVTPWAPRVKLADATYPGIWELPVIGEVSAPGSVLIRPDGHVAWVGELNDRTLIDALTTWFGAPKG